MSNIVERWREDRLQLTAEIERLQEMVGNAARKIRDLTDEIERLQTAVGEENHINDSLRREIERLRADLNSHCDHEASL